MQRKRREERRENRINLKLKCQKLKLLLNVKVSSWEEFIAGRKYAVKTKNDQGNVVDVASEIYAERKRKRKKEETDDSQGSETDPEEVCKKQLVHNLVNFRMKQGKKTRVRAIFNETLQRLAKTDRDGVQIISDALENVKPICEVARVRIAGNVYDFPGVVAKDRQQTLAVRWILDAAFKRRTNHSSRLEACLFAEIMDAYRKRGTARKKRENLHDLAANYRSYAHFRWW